jgi:hypothetical protein
MSPLNGKTFVLELSRDIRFKAKQELINYLREQNAQISYILTASVCRNSLDFFSNSFFFHIDRLCSRFE